MTISELLRDATDKLNNAGCENAYFDAVCLMEQATGKDRSSLLLSAFSEPGSDAAENFLKYVERRASREPLQYILGNWEFMGLLFNVGPGVLIPRPETELLIDFAIERLKTNTENPVVFDLCAGTGCIGISIAKFCPQVTVFLLENSPEAYKYLLANIELHSLDNVKPLLKDVFNGYCSDELPEPDLIVSNPPYIATAELETIQREVLFEPASALDGGEDGLIFYRCLATQWLPYLKDEGAMAVEIGDIQGEDVLRIFQHGDRNVTLLKDFSGKSRVVRIT